MNKSDLIDHIYAGNGEMTKAAAERVLNVVTDTITHAVASGDTVTLVGFGTFKSATRAARSGRNPSTGAAIDIPAATVPKFTPGSAFKEAVNKLTKPSKGNGKK